MERLFLSCHSDSDLALSLSIPKNTMMLQVSDGLTEHESCNLPYVFFYHNFFMETYDPKVNTVPHLRYLMSSHRESERDQTHMREPCHKVLLHLLRFFMGI